MDELEDRLFRLPADVVGDIWMIITTPERVYFRVEAMRRDEALYHKAEQEVGDEFGLPLTIDAVAPGTLFPTRDLLEPALKGKPKYYCHAESLEAAPKSLPEMWMGAFLAELGLDVPPGPPPSP
jgi:hypothetical protein